MIEEIEVGKKYKLNGNVVKISSKIPESYEIEYSNGSLVTVLWPDVKENLEEIRPESLKEQIEEKYPDYDVRMFEWDGEYWRLQNVGSWVYPSDCPFIRGFYRFVYEDNENPSHFILSDFPYLKGMTEPQLPVAVLFNKEKYNDDEKIKICD